MESSSESSTLYSDLTKETEHHRDPSTHVVEATVDFSRTFALITLFAVSSSFFLTGGRQFCPLLCHCPEGTSDRRHLWPY